MSFVSQYSERRLVACRNATIKKNFYLSISKLIYLPALEQISIIYLACTYVLYSDTWQVCTSCYLQGGNATSLWLDVGQWSERLSRSVAAVRQLAFGLEPTSRPFVFRPEDGPRASYDYQRRFGLHGQRLVELLGSGGPDRSLGKFRAAR